MATEKKRVSKQQLIRKRRKRQIALLAIEMVLLLVLGAGCFVVSKLDMIQKDDIDMNQIYRPSFENNRPQIADSDLTSEAATQAPRPTQGIIIEEPETQKPTKAEPVESAEETIKETETVKETEAPVAPDDNFTDDYGTTIDGYLNILLVGVDNSGEGQESLTSQANSDTMIVCSINTKTDEVKLASIYRDTYMKMPSNIGGYNKANYALMHGNIIDTLNTMNMNLDLYLTDYVVVNWRAVARVVDLLGGIEANVTESLIKAGGYNGYVTEIVKTTGMGSNQIWTPGVQHLDGVQTVAYCRVRYGSTDYERTERQREVITKLLEQMKRVDLKTLIQVMNEMLPQIATSLNTGDMLIMATHAMRYQISGAVGFPFDKYSNSSVGSISIPDPVVAKGMSNNVMQLHNFLYGANGYAPTAVLRDIDYYIGQVSGLY